jgi:hypothetical protein
MDLRGLVREFEGWSKGREGKISGGMRKVKERGTCASYVTPAEGIMAR